MLKDPMNQCRSYRRLYEDVRTPFDKLKDMIDTAKVTGSAANAQPLRYRIIRDSNQCAKVFLTIGWAVALKSWGGSEPGERLSTYIAVICDPFIRENRRWDEEITSQTIMLNAVEKGYGGCIIGNYGHPELLKILSLGPDKYCAGLLLALGKPREEMVMVPVGEDQDTMYYRDENRTYYAPKRNLGGVLIRSQNKEGVH